jgi:hypothetical protein
MAQASIVPNPAVEAYLAGLPPERQEIMQALVELHRNNLPAGFEEVIGSGMPGWVVPHSTYPAGYHCDPKLPLPFINIASQKNHIALYHMGMYAATELLDWFTTQYPLHSKKKLDMGKSCIRWKKAEDVPLVLIGELLTRVTPEQWIERYEANLGRGAR